jgi:Icc-related predicted phosphoesterase
MKFFKSSVITKSCRILYGSDFHGSNTVFRKFLAAGMQYKVNALVVGGDITGKAMIPVVNQGKGRYIGYLFGREEVATNAEELERVKKDIGAVGFYPIVVEPDEAEALEKDPFMMGKRFEQEMAQRVREWMILAEQKLAPERINLYFMCGNDDLFSIDEVIREFPFIQNPDMTRLEMDIGFDIVGLSDANMTPWKCERDLEETELEKKLDTLASLVRNPENTIAVLHVPPYDSGLDLCPELDKNLKIITQGGQVVMKSAGSKAVRAWIERIQPVLSLHGHIHESPGHVHIGRTLAVNAGSEYAEAILKAAIINLENNRVKGHLLIST